jgi:ribosomal protein L11 methyltransferase
MSWIQLSLVVEPQHAEALSDALSDIGALSVFFTDNEDTPIYEPDLGSTPLWANTKVTGMFSARDEEQAIKNALFQALPSFDFAHTPMRVEILEDKDWVRAWMDDYHPMQFGENLWICPSWCEAPNPHAVNILLDPGLAFGTGTHPTTALCLEWLSAHPPKGLNVLDYGCGSGILAIAALKLGAAVAIGVDIDPQALIATRDNAEKNGVSLPAYLPAGLAQDYQADLTIANILSGPLKELMPILSAHTKPGGTILLSGLLTEQLEELRSVYAPSFTMQPPDTKEEWGRLVGQKHLP